MIQLLLKNLFRSGLVKSGFLFLLLAGIAAMLVGKQFLQNQEKNISAAATYQKLQIERNAHAFKDENVGYMLYYVRFGIVNRSLPISGLSIGQRDVNPSISSVTIRTLEAQKYDAEFVNPYNQLIGNIDFSFVLIYLLPLLIIAFTYNVLSEERENGTWKLVSVQSRRPFMVLLTLFSLRFLLVSLIYTILLAATAIVLGIPFNHQLLHYFLLSLCYILVWFAICFLITSFQKSSSFNALALLFTYLLLLVVLPGFINTYLSNKYPVPEALETTVKQRKAYHEKWDKEKSVTMNKFFAHYPQYKHYTIPSTDFSWPVYYAMQQMGDDESAVNSKELKKKLALRNEAAAAISRFIPSLHVQYHLNTNAGTGLENHLHFLDAVATYHEKIRLHFYPKIFENKQATSEDWSKWKLAGFEDKVDIKKMSMYLPLVLFTVLLIGIGLLNFLKRITNESK